MKGAVFLGNRIVELRDFPHPTPGAGDVILAVRASGLCGSDLHAYRDSPGKANTSGRCIAGHEPAGVIHAVGSAVPPEVAVVGDRVMVHHYFGCTRCDSCRSGWPQMCTMIPFRSFGNNENGGHAPFMRVPAATLVPLSESLSFTAGAAIACGTGTAWGGLEHLGDLDGATLAVFGQGPVGLSATMLATARGARVIAIDPAPARREHALRFGAVATIDPTVGASTLLRDLTAGVGVPLILETSGSTSAAMEGLAALAPWGKACFVGVGGEVRFSVGDFFRKQITLITSWSMSIVQQRQCAEFIAVNELPIDDLFSDRWGISQIVDAYEKFDRQDDGKGVVVFDELRDGPRPQTRSIRSNGEMAEGRSPDELGDVRGHPIHHGVGDEDAAEVVR